MKKSFMTTLLFFTLIVSLIGNTYAIIKVQTLTNTVENMSTGGSKTNATNVDYNYDISSDITDVIEEVSDRVVAIVVYTNNTASSSGSGAVYEVNGNKVYIVTNHHVIDGGTKIEVLFSNGQSVTASVVGSDKYYDLALLELTVDFEVKAFDLGDSDLLKVGETALVIGSPLGIDYAGTVTQGIVSAVDRIVSVDVNDDGIDDWDATVIQTDAAINPGNSGGPIINVKGELVGIASMKIADSSVEGMGFGIPVNVVKEVLTELKENGKITRPVLGVSTLSLDSLTGFARQRYGISTSQEHGLYIAEVSTASAASEAGLQKGDIIVSLDGIEITSYKVFIQTLYSKKPGDKVSIGIIRDDKSMTITANLK